MRTLQLPLRRMYTQRNMRGHGVGGLFARLARMVTPLVKTAVRAAKPIAKQTLKELGKQGLQVASSTLTDMVEGGIPMEEAMKKNARAGLAGAKETLKQGTKRALKVTQEQVREGIKRQKQTGSGRQRNSFHVARRSPKSRGFLNYE